MTACLDKPDKLGVRLKSSLHIACSESFGLFFFLEMQAWFSQVVSEV